MALPQPPSLISPRTSPFSSALAHFFSTAIPTHSVLHNNPSAPSVALVTLQRGQVPIAKRQRLVDTAALRLLTPAIQPSFGSPPSAAFRGWRTLPRGLVFQEMAASGGVLLTDGLDRRACTGTICGSSHARARLTRSHTAAWVPRSGNGRISPLDLTVCRSARGAADCFVFSFLPTFLL